MPRDEAEPLDADLRRLHVTVSRRLLEKLGRARDGLSHALPGATMEQVLERALDVLLEQQARRKALVKRPRKIMAGPSSTAPSPRPSPPVGERELFSDSPSPSRAPARAPAPPPAPKPPRPPIPAALEREVRLRDGDRCQFPLDSSGICGSTWQVQLDHIHPLALGGETTVANLRCCCARHNRWAAEEQLGGHSSTRRLPRPRTSRPKRSSGALIAPGQG